DNRVVQRRVWKSRAQTADIVELDVDRAVETGRILGALVALGLHAGRERDLQRLPVEAGDPHHITCRSMVIVAPQPEAFSTTYFVRSVVPSRISSMRPVVAAPRGFDSRTKDGMRPRPCATGVTTVSASATFGMIRMAQAGSAWISAIACAWLRRTRSAASSPS